MLQKNLMLSKKITSSDLETLKEAIQLSASSYGLQPYKVLIIENPEIQRTIKTFFLESISNYRSFSPICICKYC